MRYEESQNVELKAILSEDVKNEILAFLNTHGGTVFVGVNDDGSLAPPLTHEGRDEVDSRLGNWLREAFFPVPTDLVSHDFTDDGVLAIRINEGLKKPYYLREKGPKPSGVYIRDGRSTRKAYEDEILGMIMESRDYSFEADASPNQELTFFFFNEEARRLGLNLTDHDFFSFGIKDKNGLYTNLALLLSDQSPVEVKLAELDKEMNFKVKKTFSGSLLKCLRDVQDQCERLNDVRAVIDGSSFQRKEIPSYPGASLREMVLNAFCHADYFIKSNIKVEFTERECKIISPGGLYGVDMAGVLKGVQTYRNPGLVRVLNRVGLIENFGTGIPRTIEAYSRYEQKPLFEPNEKFFIVRLPNLHALVSEKGTRGCDQVNDQVKSLTESILKYVNENPGARVPEITDSLKEKFPDLTENMVHNHIRRFLRDYLVFKGPSKTGGYYPR
ncbi:MAG: hypothetical protein E7179_05950 [Erysipelotrichaceae bacterium]|jgi:ATP-dependent DNA helicase RecG|nr:hypothetical protein [Erysipelotrichaceae bacterium]